MLDAYAFFMPFSKSRTLLCFLVNEAHPLFRAPAEADLCIVDPDEVRAVVAGLLYAFGRFATTLS